MIRKEVSEESGGINCLQKCFPDKAVYVTAAEILHDLCLRAS